MDRLTRRGSLAKLGGLLVNRGGGGRAARAHVVGQRGDRDRRRAVCLDTRADRRPVLPRRREGAPRHPRRALPAPSWRFTSRCSTHPRASSRPRTPPSTFWHADAAGDYSGFGSDTSSRTFMRGIQRAPDASGNVEVHHGLPRLVPGPRGAHPREGARRQGSVVQYYRPALLLPGRGRPRRRTRPRRTSRGPVPTCCNAQDSIYVNGAQALRDAQGVTKTGGTLRRVDRHGAASTVSLTA